MESFAHWDDDLNQKLTIFSKTKRFKNFKLFLHNYLMKSCFLSLFNVNVYHVEKLYYFEKSRLIFIKR